MRKLAFLLAAALLLTCVSSPAAAVPDDLPEGSLVLDSPTAVYPQDKEIAGDLLLTGSCPKEVVLINVKVKGFIRVDADHTVTVRLQGSSTCAGAMIDSTAFLYGSGWKNIAVSAPLVQMYGSTDKLTINQPNALCVLDGPVGELTLAAPGIAVGGGGQAESVTIQAVNCAADIRCNELRQDTTRIPAVQGHVVATPVVDPANSVIEATVTFTDVPAELAGDYLLQWYFGQTQVSITYHYDLTAGRSDSITCSAHFPELVGDTIPVWVLITPNSGKGSAYRFGTQVANTAQKATVLDVEYPYSIDVNRQENTVMVYALDDDGEYTRLVQVFACSVGRNKLTPTGNFSIKKQRRWNQLLGEVFGQYTSQIHENVLFHSVPCFEDRPSTLEYDQYNKLGGPASAGCIRLCVQDAKWIYDNCVPGTPVHVFDSDELPVTQPVSIKIDKDYSRRGWDPTDPAASNPTHAAEPMAPLSLYSLRPLRAVPYVE